MQAQLAAIAYVSVALAAAYVLTRSVTNERWYRLGLTLWCVSVAVMFGFLGAKGLTLITLAALLVIMTPRPPEQKLPFLILIICAIPVTVKASIPFPAINYLIAVDFPVLVGMLLVAPLFIAGRKDRVQLLPVGWGGYFMGAYIAVTTLLMFRVLPVTATARFGVEAVLGIFIIYLFIARFANSVSILEKALAAIYITAVILACIALMTQLKHWNFYSLVDTDFRIFKAGEVRYGFLRTNTTINSVLFGFIESLGIVLLLRQRQLAGRLPKYGRLMAFLLAMGFFVSMSRGAWLAGLVAIGAYFLLKSRLSNSLNAIIILSCAIVLSFAVFTGGGVSEELDPFQTIDYRRQLFIASWDQFLSAPFLGNPFFLESGRFDELVQGEGIVDVVSVYLGVVLQFGLVGLLLYIAPFLTAFQGILRLRNKTDATDVKTRTLLASLGAFILGYLTMIATTSNTSLVNHYGIILVALGSAAVVVTTRRLSIRPRETPLSSAMNLP